MIRTHRTRISLAAAAAVASTSLLGGAAVQAQVPGVGVPEYCSPSIGCIGQYQGKNIYAPFPYMTGQEKEWMLECNLEMGGALVGAVSRDPKQVIDAIVDAGKAILGPCKSAHDSFQSRTS